MSISKSLFHRKRVDHEINDEIRGDTISLITSFISQKLSAKDEANSEFPPVDHCDGDRPAVIGTLDGIRAKVELIAPAGV